MANRVIITGVLRGWVGGGEDKSTIRRASAAKDGRSYAENAKKKKRKKKPGHMLSHCSNVFKCGHYAAEQPTWECPSTRGQTIPDKCATCGGGHQPVSRDCPVKIASMNEAKQAPVGCPLYHRSPLHFRNTASRDTIIPRRADPYGKGRTRYINKCTGEKAGRGTISAALAGHNRPTN
jgi:hypothetical protein